MLQLNDLLDLYSFFFSTWVFFHNHSRITGLQGKREGISLTPHQHFHPLHIHLNISQAIAPESSPLHVGSSRTRTGNLRFLSANKSLTTKQMPQQSRDNGAETIRMILFLVSLQVCSSFNHGQYYFVQLTKTVNY